MKNIVIVLFLLIGSSTAFGQTVNVKFNKEAHDFGKIKQNKPATFTFTFTNKDKLPVTIQSAQASCGCTTPDWTKTPIKSGKTGTIKVIYDAKNIGEFTKTITIKFEGNVEKIVTIKGNVVQ